MTNEYFTIEDEEGNLRPMQGLWRNDENLKYYQPEIDKYMIKAKKEGLKLVLVKILKSNN
jgi:hypothetical protein